MFSVIVAVVAVLVIIVVFALFVKRLFGWKCANLEGKPNIAVSSTGYRLYIDYCINAIEKSVCCKGNTIGKIEMNSATIGIDMALRKSLLETLQSKKANIEKWQNVTVRKK